VQNNQEKAKNFLELLFRLIKEIHPHFHKDSIHMEDDFEKDLELDSLSRFELISRVQEEFHITLVKEALYEIQSPKELFELILNSKIETSFNSYKSKSPLKLEEISALPNNAKTLIDVLQWHIKEHPKRIHIQFFQDDGKGEKITYSQLYEKALKITSSLQKLGLKPQEAVAIMLPTCAEYFYSFFGILLAGGIPVPIYPPARASQLEEHIQRHTRILENCEASILITLPEVKVVATLLKSYVQNIKEVITAKQLLDSKISKLLPSISANDIAFIQYTSGSTGDPKGVILKHNNLIANIKAMGERVKANSKNVFVSWLPLYHDMGLIGAWMGSLYHSSLFVVMSPLDFLSKPQRWLWAIHKYGGTLTAAPNFAYEYCVHRLKDTDLKGLDLSSLRAAFNGAEAVSPLTMKNFSEYFKNYGFNKNAMTPVYGLAESSVGLVFSPINRAYKIDSIQRDLFMNSKIAKPAKDEASLEFVSSGLPLKNHQIRIVDTFGHELPERNEGVLQFKGASSTSGYYKNPMKTKELIDNDSWVNTGDQAYIAQGELYITGRIKDIIIRAGRNIYPDQLEKAIGNIEGVRKGCVAIFGRIDKRTATEHLVILTETKNVEKENKEELIRKISQLANDLLGAPADEIVLAQKGAVLKTSSGKIRRNATKELFETHKGKAQSQNLLLQFTRLTLKSLLPNIKRLFNFIRSNLFNIYNWLIFGIFGFISWVSLIIFPSSQCYKTARFFAKAVRFFSSIHINIKGLEKVDFKKSIIVVNHSSYIDVFALVAVLPTEISFVAKAEFKDSFFTRIPLKKLNIQFVERYDFSKSLKGTEKLYKYNKNKPLLFFPEGTFTRVPGLRPFHMGAFSLAVKKELSIIPIAIQGTRSILRPDSWFIQNGEINIEVGEEIFLKQKHKGLSNWDKALLLSEKSRNFILKHCKEPDLIYE